MSLKYEPSSEALHISDLGEVVKEVVVVEVSLRLSLDDVVAAQVSQSRPGLIVPHKPANARLSPTLAR